MPYRLEADESIPRGLRRIAREEIDSAIENLRVRQPSKRDGAVHEARKSIKKLRGLVRLLTPGLGTAGKQENTALRDLGRTLSEVRDAAAMIETVDLLGKKYHDDPAVTKLAPVRAAFVKRRNAARAHADSTPSAEEGIVALRRLRRRLNTWNIGAEFDCIAPGLKKTYRRGRNALARARKDPDAVNLHNLRKRVKDYWYQVRLLESVWPLAPLCPETLCPEKLCPEKLCPEKTLKELQEQLGDAHNLAVLRETAGKGFEGVAHLIDDFEKELRTKSLLTAKDLYAQKAGAHVDRMNALWMAWRDDTERKGPKTVSVSAANTTSAA
jgi:CHAD domain-containing protein